MKAVQIKKYGGIDVLNVLNIPKPIPNSGQVLIEAYASSINPVDILTRQGFMSKMSSVQLPFTLGADVAGVVVQVGKDVESITVGEKVYGQGIIFAGATGAFAEYVATPKDLVAPMPDNISFKEAAAVVLTGVSAVQAIIDHLNLKINQKILIHGAAGGIGTIAVQIAKKNGAYVIATAGTQDLDYVKKLGADEIIDYQTQEFEEIVSDCDAVLDTVGSDTNRKSYQVLKRGGVIVSMISQPDEELMVQYGVTAIAQITKVNSKYLNILSNYLKDDGIKVHIDKVYSLDNIKEAFAAKEKENIKGKIVIEIKKEN